MNSIRFLLDENAPKRLNAILKAKGYQSETLHELHNLGISNGEVVQYVIANNAILITCDADFLKFKKEIQKQIRVIYFKVNPRNFQIIKNKIDILLNVAIESLKNPGIFTIYNSGYEFKTF